MSKNIYVSAVAFNNIKNREKTIEGRIKKGLFNHIYLGEIIHFVCNKTNMKCSAKITKINTYNSVYEFLKNEKINKIIPYCNSYDINNHFDYALNIYKKHYGEKLNNKSYKFVAIHIDLL